MSSSSHRLNGGVLNGKKSDPEAISKQQDPTPASYLWLTKSGYPTYSPKRAN
jgi:hypothetical protein